MTSVPPGISRAKPSDPGLDYAALRREAIDLVQAMSGEIWTDYNYSDPGVTILEQLCYALTDAVYRASRFDAPQLLAGPDGRALPMRRRGLHPALAILPCNPVTENDIRRLALDRVREVANVWFTPAPAAATGGVSGIWDVAVLIRRSERHADEPRRHAILRRVRECYVRHRALCEDIREARALRPAKARIRADVELAPHADPAQVMADLLFRTQLRLAPQPKRLSLREQIAEGKSPDEIFTGPQMTSGFIADEELIPTPFRIPVDDILATMAETDGVLLVESLSVECAESPGRTFRGGQTIEAPPHAFLDIGTDWPAQGFEVRLLHRGAPREPYAPHVRRALKQAWASHERRHPVRADYAQRRPPPAAARPRDLADYTMLREQFPNVYGVNEHGLSATASPARRAKAKQLKGYLFPFDQLMANFLAELESLGQTFSVEGANKGAAWQSLRKQDDDGLLKPEYEARLAELAASEDPTLAKQEQVVDFLLSLYGSRLRFPAPRDRDHPDREIAHRKRRLEAKRLLLKRAASATRDRGRGLDYSRSGERFASGLAFLSRIELGWLHAPAPEPEAEVVTRITIEIVERGEEGDFGKRLPNQSAATIEQHYRRAPEIVDHLDLQPHLSPLHGRRVPAPLMATLDDPHYYRLQTLREAEVALVCADPQGGWWLIDRYPSEQVAIESMTHIAHSARRHGERDRHPHLRIVEWTLLRHASDGAREGREGQRYNFRVTAVLSAHPGRYGGPGWRLRAREIVRAYAPAHVAVEFVFLGHARMDEFERLHAQWTHALRRGAPQELAEASRALETFLVRHGEPPEPRPASEKFWRGR